MDFENWWLLAFPSFFLLGWLAAKIDVRQLLDESKKIPSTYIEGLNFLLNEEKDKAIDVLVKLSVNEPDSVELQFAVGSLFRSNGEIQRALAVHQGLLDRPDLTNVQRNRAVLAVGEDFFKSGMYDRAEDFLKRVRVAEYAPHALRLLIDLYVNQNDWHRAVDAANQLQFATGRSNSREIAHFMVEISMQHYTAGDDGEAIDWLRKALKVESTAPRPRVVLGEMLKSQGRYLEAIDEWDRLELESASFISLIADALIECHDKLGTKVQCLEKFKKLTESSPSHILLTLTFRMSVELEGQEAARDLARNFLQKTSDLGWAIPILDSIKNDVAEASMADMDLLIDMATQYRQDEDHLCDSCGFRAHTYYWRCPACRLWDTYAPPSLAKGVEK
jgi:lipopolysaccharide biosynthesis regulator YciM